MKKFVIIVSILVATIILLDTFYYRMGWYIDLNPDAPIETFVKTDENTIYINEDGNYEPFVVKGVDLGSGIPEEWPTDFAIDKETYLRWFQQIQAMGANTIRVYTMQSDVFYNALYEYNRQAQEPLWLLQGLYMNDYVQFSHIDIYDKDFYNKFVDDGKTLIDAIHGNKKIYLGRMATSGSGRYNKDVSQWVIGYILGTEWEADTIAYADDKYRDLEKYNTYQGEYLYTLKDASPFETMLAKVGDKLIEYETRRYKEQRLLSFSNCPPTDPFDYSGLMNESFTKTASLDTENIQKTDEFIAGQFASYHTHAYFPDYLYNVNDLSSFGIENLDEYKEPNGKINTYKVYLAILNHHHDMPIVITEFGASSGRGMYNAYPNADYNRYNMSEFDQGLALVKSFEDIMSTGCNGGCLYSWQDEWTKRNWNTMYAVNLSRTPFWCDYQTSEQHYGILAFDPGEKQSICYVDGETSEWHEEDIVIEDNDGLSLAMKYDEKFVYLLVKKNDLNLNEDQIYIPLDITPKTGSNYCENHNLKFDREADFLIVIYGKENSRILVQERYEALRSTYAQDLYGFDTYAKENVPEKNSPIFKKINMILDTNEKMDVNAKPFIQSYETGKLTYGNANPKSPTFNSLADFAVNGDYLEIKIPWQLLNFADPSRMTIHDDYYDDNYGVEYLAIDEIYLGVGENVDNQRIHLVQKEMTGWENEVTYHERLKPSYYMMQELWRGQ